MRKKTVGITSCCVVGLCDRFPGADDSDLKNSAVHSKLKIAKNPNFDSTFIHCSAATARMKTNLLNRYGHGSDRDRIAIDTVFPDTRPCRGKCPKRTRESWEKGHCHHYLIT